jgi:putative transposase
VLVIIGVNEGGQKHFLAIEDGVRESKHSWKDVLHHLKDRGLSVAPKLAVGDGALGFWAALSEVFPTIATQRCWVHKMVNALNYCLRACSPRRRAHCMRSGWPNKAKAQASFDRFAGVQSQVSQGGRLSAQRPRGVVCLL